MTNLKPLAQLLKSQNLKCCLREDQEKSSAAQVPLVAGNLLD